MFQKINSIVKVLYPVLNLVHYEFTTFWKRKQHYHSYTATSLVKTKVSFFLYKILEQHVLCFYHAAVYLKWHSDCIIPLICISNTIFTLTLGKNDKEKNTNKFFTLMCLIYKYQERKLDLILYNFI